MSNYRLQSLRPLDAMVKSNLPAIAKMLGAGDDGDGRTFWCVRCQETPGQRISHGPAAVTAPDDAGALPSAAQDWRCIRCGASGTAFSLASAILQSPVLSRELAVA